MALSVAPLIFPHQSPGRQDRHQSVDHHHHTRSRSNTRSRHIRRPRHHTRGARMGSPGSAGMFGLEPVVGGGTQAEAPSLLLWWAGVGGLW